MIHDVMDVLCPRKKYTATATYYPTRTNDPSTGGVKISCKFVDNRSRTYHRLFGNVQDLSSDTVAIETPDRLDYIIGGIIVTGDGACYRIFERGTNYMDAPQQALRLFSIPIGTAFVLRLQSINNPWGQT